MKFKIMKAKKETLDINIKNVPIETARLLRTIAEDKGITRHNYILKLLIDKSESYKTKQLNIYNSQKQTK